jgi:hypothetical protein
MFEHEFDACNKFKFLKELEPFQNDYQDFELMLYYRWRKDFKRFGEYGELQEFTTNIIQMEGVNEVSMRTQETK